MRTLGAPAHLLLAVAAAGGLTASLSHPWYGSAPRGHASPAEDDLTGRVTAAADAATRAFAEREGTTGWDAFTRVDLVLAGLAGALVLLLLLSLAPPLAHLGRGLARLAALAALGIVGWRLVDIPSGAGAEPRIGLLVAAACAATALGCAGALAAAPRRRHAAVATYTPPPAPQYDAGASYGPPQY